MLTKALNKYYWIAITSAKSNIAYLGEVGSRVIFLGVILFIFLRLWQVTYHETGVDKLGGLTLSQMLWYLAVTESIILSAPRVSSMVDQDVRTGQLAVHLIKPLSYPLYCLSNCLGERLVRFLMNLVVGLSVVTLFVGPIPINLKSILFLVCAIPMAFVLDFLANFIIGLGAFWLEDTTGLMLIYSRITMILGGMLIPLELFPEYMQPVLKVLPFASIVYGPARMFVKPDFSEFLGLLLNQSVALAILAFAVWLVFKLASSRIFANGG